MKRILVLALLLAALPSHAVIKSLPSAGGSGSVTSVSVVTANGFAGTVATATSTPAITLTTTVTGLIKGNGSAIAAAAAADVVALWSGTCSSATFLRGDGACAALASGDIPATLNGAAVTVIATTNQANTGTPTIDGFATTANVSIVLDTAQSTGAQNGPWVVQSGAWTRPAWYPTGGTTQVTGYSSVIVRQGTTYQGSTWKQTTAAPITIDTTTTTWVVLQLALNANTLTGTVGVTNGGNGLATATLGDIRYGSGTNTLAALPGNITATKQFLTQTGTGSVSAIPAWAGIVGGDLPTGSPITWTAAPQTINLSGQTAATDIDTFISINSTPAAAGAQQNICTARTEAQGWKTNATAASQSVVWRQCNDPVQGTAAPTGNLNFTQSINGGAFGPVVLQLTGTSINVANLGGTTGTAQAFLAGFFNSNGSSGLGFVGNNTGPATIKSQTATTELWGGTAFTVSGCGTAAAITGHGTRGTFTVGTGAVTCTFVVTINGATGLTAAHGWNGTLIDSTAGLNCLETTAVSTTTATFLCNSVVTTGDLIRVIDLRPY